MAKKVTIIKPISDEQHTGKKKRLRVCAYVRVSTASKAQAESYATQVEYYTNLIQGNPLWEFAGIYADEATTGTKTKRRDEFQLMIDECLDGGIDLIITKSVTRFARNTVDSIKTIRKLKSLGIGIYFEKENVNTLTEKSELLITVLSSLAQSESEDFSGNNKWSIIKRFKDGTFIIGTPAYGYRNDENGNLIIHEDEAVIVRWIYQTYLNGAGAYTIAKELNNMQVPTIRTSEQWQESVVQDILINDVYMGNLTSQKTYTTEVFPYEKKTNHGEMDQYLIEDDHEAIIEKEEWQAVQELYEYRRRILHICDMEKYQNRYLFSSRITCGVCGGTFRRQKIYIGKPYEKIIWTCHKHVEDKSACDMKAVREDAIHQAFITMWNKLYTNQGTLLEPFLEELRRIPLSRELKNQLTECDNQIQKLTEQSRILNQVMKKGYMDSAIFMEKQNLLVHELGEARRNKTRLLGKNGRRKEIARTEQLIGVLKSEEGLLTEFDEKRFDLMVDTIRIEKNHAVTFCLKNHMELTEGGKEDAVAYTNRISD